MKKRDRRTFLKQSIASSAALGMGLSGCNFSPSESTSGHETGENPSWDKIDAAAQQPVLNKAEYPDALIISSIELLRKQNTFICRVRTKNGLTGYAASNFQMQYLYPIFKERVAPYFIGKDARDLESLLEGLYLHKSNYKLQNLALWVPVATLEFALLDLLGKSADKSIGELLGGVKHKKIAVYQANNHRGESAEASVENIRETVEKTGAKALKFKIGGRMGNREVPVGRSEKLIPLVRATFGDDFTIYCDSNGSYDVAEAIRIGKIIEAHKLDFYEEPCPFDWYDETKAVAEALRVPIAGGEQEPSLRKFRWLIGHNALDVVQPDIFYFGGMIRSMRVARMAEAAGKVCVPHISGGDLGYLYMAHFVSALPNAGPYHEFKGMDSNIEFDCPTSDLKSMGGYLQVPTGAGLGIELNPSFLNALRPL